MTPFSARDKPDTTILLRIGDRFERVESALGKGRFKLANDGRMVSFDRGAREWIEQR